MNGINPVCKDNNSNDKSDCLSCHLETVGRYCGSNQMKGCISYDCYNAATVKSSAIAKIYQHDANLSDSNKQKIFFKDALFDLNNPIIDLSNLESWGCQIKDGQCVVTFSNSIPVDCANNFSYRKSG